MSTQMEMARAERADFADFLATLTPQQWDAGTLCSAWTVKDVVAHVISYEELGFAGLIKRFARGRVVRANEVGVREYSSLTPEQLVAFLAEHVRPQGLTARFDGMIALVDGTVHQQDIRRPLGLPRTIPPDRLRRVLQLLPPNPRLGVPWRIRGLRLRATDVDWEYGRGLEVTGPGEALMMALAGRVHSVDELTGPGRAVLAARLQR
ncbi:maleylpyruvate isomerase family mycothiol-dependent enzyme [Mycobacterium sp. NAZ190054]|uniref:maleylpyruvate isomerase family mycothiol-dependent enzyme n=1 Tax=Mycobacterium sp. NAZ190054 TaxID=1747766 RepID=UPI000797D894|nr:maleylpyruvate isomerase family mycothiol-dependent enzyme [Mycobacterium sp. NAZ190054]KWX68728.1 DinB family protein [Mycobacterium sp. NAZ190054]